jgi:hypothetical protein
VILIGYRFFKTVCRGKIRAFVSPSVTLPTLAGQTIERDGFITGKSKSIEHAELYATVHFWFPEDKRVLLI